MSAAWKGRPLLGWSVGFLLLAGLVASVHFSLGWATLLNPWREIRLPVMAGALALVLGSYVLRTIRVHGYFQPDTSHRFLLTFRLILVHNLLNNLLPMRTGEASFPLLMARGFRIPFSRSIPGLVYLRVLDLHFVLFLATVLISLERGSVAWLFPLAIAPIPYGIYRSREWLGAKFEDRGGRLWEVGKKALVGLPASPGLFWRSWLWTAVNWTAKLAVFAWILRAFTPMPFPHALLGSATGEMSSVLPFHGIAGAGSYEAGVLAGLLPLGVELDAALKGAVNLHLFVLGASVLAGTLAALIPFAGRNLDETVEDS